MLRREGKKKKKIGKFESKPCNRENQATKKKKKKKKSKSESQFTFTEHEDMFVSVAAY